MTRDPARIDPILEKLRDLWKAKPDLRLTQLVWNLAAHEGESAPKFFYTEDDQLHWVFAPPVIRAPWTPEQVEQLNRWQQLGIQHSFTCGNVMHNISVDLVATTEGWVCPNAPCEYTQDWAYAGMDDKDYMDRQERFISNMRKRSEPEL